MIATIIWIVILAMSWTISLAKHGEEEGKYSAGWTLISVAVHLLLGYYMGVFNNFN